MAEQNTTRKPYPSDLSDAEWQKIEPLIPKPRTNRGRKRKHPIREILNAIFYLLRAELRQADGREPEPSAAILDTQSVKTTSVKGVRGYDAGKKVKGRKRHILVDTLGLLLLVIVHAADIQDRDGAKLVLGKAKQLFSRLRLIWADGIYAGKLVDWVKETCGWILEIVKRDPNAKGFQVLPRRWVVERTFGWLNHYRRLSKDYEVLPETSEAMIYAAMVHIMVRRLGRRPQVSSP